MATTTITAGDTLTLYGRVFTDLADGDVSAITFPNDFVNLKTGKNRNTIYSKNVAGENAEMVLRLIRGSSDDRFLSTKLTQIENDFASTVLAQGQLVKRLGDGNGVITSDVYQLVGGVIYKKVEGKENVDGDVAQAVAIYNFKFASARRTIQ